MSAFSPRGSLGAVCAALWAVLFAFLADTAHPVAYLVLLGYLHLRILFLSKLSGPFLKEWLGRGSDLCLRTQSRSPAGCDT